MTPCLWAVLGAAVVAAGGSGTLLFRGMAGWWSPGLKTALAAVGALFVGGIAFVAALGVAAAVC